MSLTTVFILMILLLNQMYHKVFVQVSCCSHSFNYLPTNIIYPVLVYPRHLNIYYKISDTYGF